MAKVFAGISFSSEIAYEYKWQQVTGTYYRSIFIRHSGGIGITEAVMGPVIAILTGAVLIAAGIVSSSEVPQWAGIILSVAGVATVLIGMIMLFSLALQGKQGKK